MTIAVFTWFASTFAVPIVAGLAAIILGVVKRDAVSAIAGRIFMRRAAAAPAGLPAPAAVKEPGFFESTPVLGFTSSRGKRGAIVAILVGVIILVFYIRLNDAREELPAKKEEIANLKAELDSTQGQLNYTDAQLKASEAERARAEARAVEAVQATRDFQEAQAKNQALIINRLEKVQHGITARQAGDPKRGDLGRIMRDINKIGIESVPAAAAGASGAGPDPAAGAAAVLPEEPAISAAAGTGGAERLGVSGSAAADPAGLQEGGR
jgi:hypothetical protein